MKIIGIIPARYASSRFPGKPLANLGDKSIIERVYQQCKKSLLLDDICVATENNDIYNHVIDFGGNAVMTLQEHENGTSRCLEALNKQKKEYDFVINIQGDEPFIVPTQIDELAKLLVSSVQLATMVKKIESADVLLNNSEVKVVVNNNHEALYFSRAVIPFANDDVPKNEWHKKHTYLKHIGLYAYRTNILHDIVQLPPSSLEQVESLEQLRWLENGYKIKVGYTTFETQCIDTPEDLEKAKAMLEL